MLHAAALKPHLALSIFISCFFDFASSVDVSVFFVSG
jgi:hypothetical protein